MLGKLLLIGALVLTALVSVEPLGPNLIPNELSDRKALANANELVSQCGVGADPVRGNAIAIVSVEIAHRDHWDRLADFATKNQWIASFPGYQNYSLGHAQIRPEMLLRHGLVDASSLHSETIRMIDDRCHALDLAVALSRHYLRAERPCEKAPRPTTCVARRYNGQSEINRQNMAYLTTVERVRRAVPGLRSGTTWSTAVRHAHP